jgi:hypothetical protein
MTQTPSAPGRRKGPWEWAANPKAGGAATIAALLIGLTLIGLELALGRDGRPVPMEELPGFYAVCGLALAALVWGLGLALRALLSVRDDRGPHSVAPAPEPPP